VLELCAVAAGSLAPANWVAVRHLPSDKLLHFTGYLVAAALPAIALIRKRSLLLATTGLVLLGTALEYAQRFSPGRVVESGDLGANLTGILCGLLVGLVIRRWLPVAPDSL
jgi:VanZ family protein